MAIFRVHRVRKEPPALNRSHEHIVGVLTEDGAFYTNQQVVESIAAGNVWTTSVPGERDAEIRPEPYCTHEWCMLQPYLSSSPGDTLATDLEKLPRG